MLYDQKAEYEISYSFGLKYKKIFTNLSVTSLLNDSSF